MPPNASPGTGFETVLLNDAQDQITVDLSFSGLTASATAAHIHGPAPAGTNGPVVFFLTGVPAATSGTLQEQTFSVTPAQVVELESGLLYADMHTTTFPGGEIRGTIGSIRGGNVRRISALVLPALLYAALPAAAQTSLAPQISGNSVTAKIQLPGGVEADLSIAFEQVVGLNSNALALSAALISPSDATLMSRMPDPASFSIPAGFPVLVRIDPTPGSGLSFSGVSRVSLYTHNLTFTAGSPLRLYTAHGGGAFRDMTGSLDPGSVPTMVVVPLTLVADASTGWFW